MNVVLVAHHERTEVGRLAAEAAGWLTAHGHRVLALDADARAIGLPDLGCGDEVDADTLDLAVSLGGDGTMLRTVDLVSSAGVPILGVNAGQLGYLTEVEPEALTLALHRFVAGEVHVDERMMLEVAVAGTDPMSFHALNEAVIDKLQAGHTVRLRVTIDGSPFTTYHADGLIVATPTGSTAYSLSARGPVVSPRLRAVLVTAVSPHMLFDRTLVLDPGEPVEVRLEGHRSAALTIDGRDVGRLEPGDVVTFRASPRVARLVRLGTRHFHQILKHKFGLSDR